MTHNLHQIGARISDKTGVKNSSKVIWSHKCDSNDLGIKEVIMDETNDEPSNSSVRFWNLRENFMRVSRFVDSSLIQISWHKRKRK